MDIAQSFSTTIKTVSFSHLPSEEIKRISVKQITNPVLLNDVGRPNPDGLYDPALGPVDNADLCATCGRDRSNCEGHYGHIELPAPVFHPLFFTGMVEIFRGICMYCHKFKPSPTAKAVVVAELQLLDHGLLKEAQEVKQMGNRFQPKQSAKKAKGKEVATEDEEEEEDSLDATPNERDLTRQIESFVKSHLARASPLGRDNFHDTHVHQARADVIKQFIRSMSLRTCGNCGAKAFTVKRQDGQVVEVKLAKKNKAHNMLLGRVRPNVLPNRPKDTDNANDADSDEEMASDDDDGESIEHSDDDESSSGNEKPRGRGRPRKRTKDADPPSRVNIFDRRRGLTKKGIGDNRIITAEEARAHFRLAFQEDSVTSGMIWGQHGPFARFRDQGVPFSHPDLFFMDMILVPPTRWRPAAQMENRIVEHPQNTLLTAILKTSKGICETRKKLDELSRKDVEVITLPEDRREQINALSSQFNMLQTHINAFFDSRKNPTTMRQGAKPPPGIKDILEKKEGLFRKNMMGKRVNYAARSVISPDVNIETNEIGIPPVFAKKLTFPEPVTLHNIALMRQLVIQGPEYPGANFIQHEDGSIQSLIKLPKDQRMAVANQLLAPQERKRVVKQGKTLETKIVAVNKKVYRHLQDGDQLIVNRQPTLHKPSMMVHKARVLKGEKTIRLHYANCNSYNADFDGDEMNIHFPQSQVGRAEAMLIANTDNQYLVPTSGNPLRGLIQDHVVAGLWMTYKETFFDREEYQQLVYGALRPDDVTKRDPRDNLVLTVPPAIWKPKALWTGKQIISTIMKNITPETSSGMHLNSNSKVLNSHWNKYGYEKKVSFHDGTKMVMKLDGEESVIFYDGDLVCGVLDKSQFGATAYGMVHSVYELYGGDVAGRLLGILSRLFTTFLQHRAFTCRMDDLLLTPEAEKKRRKQLEKAKGWGRDAAIENFPALSNSKDVPPEQLDAKLRMLLEEVLRDDRKMENLDVSVKKKMAKLTQDVASSSIPKGLRRRFPDNHMQTMVMSGAKGSAVNARQISCGLGQQELEGRRVPTMVSGKTLPSFKPFETAAIAGGYIASRFLTGVKPQEFFFHCMAGREGLIDTAVKTSRSGYLQRCLIKQLEGLRVHYDNTVRGSDSSVYQFLYGGDGLDVIKQMHINQFDFAANNAQSLTSRTNPSAAVGRLNETDAVKHMKKILKHPNQPHRYPPTISVYSPTTHIGSTSETFAKSVENYINGHIGKTVRKKGETIVHPNQVRKDILSAGRFRDLMNMRYMRALAEPGEAIGLLAAQGIGEPSTQMTLNTFHFAGHGAANVTLGIPRLREIVLDAKRDIATPTMTLPITPGLPDDSIQTFCKKATRVTLSEVIDTVQVTECLFNNGATRVKKFEVQLTFFPPEQYGAEYLIEPTHILGTLGTAFPIHLKTELKKELKKLGESLKAQHQQLGKGKAVRDTAPSGNRGDGEDGDAGGNDDADESVAGGSDDEDEKRSKRQKEADSYGKEESDDDDGEEDRASVVDEDPQADSGDEDEVMLDVSEQKPKAKKSWKKDHAEAASSFEQNGSPYTSNLKFSKNGQRCSFDLELQLDTPKLLMVGVIERACLKTVLREIPGIKRCRKFTPEKASEGVKFMTEGSNLKGLWAFCNGEGDLNALESNDIAAVLGTYGVEMARETIIREMAGIFAVYNIKVDPRHLMLIADFMTFDGGFKPFNRSGIGSLSSVLLKATYEQNTKFLADATLYGDFDELTSPSASIVLGQSTHGGTGSFGIHIPLAVNMPS